MVRAMLTEPPRADGSKRNKRKIDPLRELERVQGNEDPINSQPPPKTEITGAQDQGGGSHATVVMAPGQRSYR